MRELMATLLFEYPRGYVDQNLGLTRQLLRLKLKYNEGKLAGRNGKATSDSVTFDG